MIGGCISRLQRILWNIHNSEIEALIQFKWQSWYRNRIDTTTDNEAELTGCTLNWEHEHDNFFFYFNHEASSISHPVSHYNGSRGFQGDVFFI